MNCIKKTGLPKKKKVLSLLTEKDQGGDCFVDGNYLYLLSYGQYSDSDLPNLVEVIDVGTGRFEDRKILMQSDSRLGSVIFNGSSRYFFIKNAQYEIYEKSTGEKIFSGKDHISEKQLTSNVNGAVVISDNFIVHRPNIREPKFNLFQLDDQSFIKSIELDFHELKLLNNDLVAGIRENGNFAVYSLTESKYVFEFVSDEYFEESDFTYSVLFCVYEDKVVLACESKIVLICSKEWVALDRLDCLDSQLTADAFDERLSMHKFVIETLSFNNNFIVANGDRYIPFSICVEIVSNKLNVRWVNSTDRVQLSSYVGGHVVYGVGYGYPEAWDLFTGEKIWRGSSSVIPYAISVGSNWLIYHGHSGNFACYQWKKEYISPNAPQQISA